MIINRPDLMMKAEDLPPSITTVLACESKKTDSTSMTTNGRDVPPVSDEAELVDNWVCYNTEQADCLGWGRKDERGRTIFRGLYKGSNGRYFRRRVVCDAPFSDSIVLDSVTGMGVGVMVGLFLISRSTSFLVELMVSYGPMAIGGVAPYIYYQIKTTCSDRENWTVVEDRLEPLSHAALLEDPQTTKERQLARTIRMDQPTWAKAGGTVTECPDGTYVYKQDEKARICSDREELREAIEAQNNTELYRRVFDDSIVA